MIVTHQDQGNIHRHTIWRNQTTLVARWHFGFVWMHDLALITSIMHDVWDPYPLLNNKWSICMRREPGSNTSEWPSVHRAPSLTCAPVFVLHQGAPLRGCDQCTMLPHMSVQECSPRGHVQVALWSTPTSAHGVNLTLLTMNLESRLMDIVHKKCN